MDCARSASDLHSCRHPKDALTLDGSDQNRLYQTQAILLLLDPAVAGSAPSPVRRLDFLLQRRHARGGHGRLPGQVRVQVAANVGVGT